MKPEQMQKLATHTQLSVRNLQALLENLLQWAASQTASDHSVRFEPKPLMLQELVQQNITLLQDTADTKQLQWQVMVPKGIQVYADANMLDFIVRNLLHNAIKFSKPKGSINLKAEVKETRFVEITVEDNGVGMAIDVVKSLFQAEQPAITVKGTANEKGTGLGLLLCRTFVERCGGSIKVKSEVDKGACFVFTMPLVTAPHSHSPERALEEEIC